jgi:hypothetical protein
MDMTAVSGEIEVGLSPDLGKFASEVNLKLNELDSVEAKRGFLWRVEEVRQQFKVIRSAQILQSMETRRYGAWSNDDRVLSERTLKCLNCGETGRLGTGKSDFLIVSCRCGYGTKKLVLPDGSVALHHQLCNKIMTYSVCRFRTDRGDDLEAEWRERTCLE